MKTATAFSQDVPLGTLLLPLIILAGLAVSAVKVAGLILQPVPAGVIPSPHTLTIPAHDVTYRQDGEFYKDGFAVDAPKVTTRSPQFSIMKYQVSEKDYGRCVEAGVCEAPDQQHRHGLDRPVTGVSFYDATRYARWLTQQTGAVWSLPTHEQAVFAAGSKFPDDALGIDPDNRNPALRWLADYDRETRRKSLSDPLPKQAGTFGENEFGLADFAGNVWEWTSTCHRRVDMAAGGKIAASDKRCGIYVTVGQHRAPMSSFVRDPKSGGCAVGTPPANLGFRLVRDDRWYAVLLLRLNDRLPMR